MAAGAFDAAEGTWLMDPSFQRVPDSEYVYARRPGYEQRRSRPEPSTFLSISSLQVPQDVDIPMDNPITVALRECQLRVVRPYERLLLVVGWQRLLDDQSSLWKKGINLLHPILVMMIIVVGYVIQYAACFSRDKACTGVVPPPKLNDTELESLLADKCNPSEKHGCQEYIISQYIIPDLLHSAAYLFSFYILRIKESEQLPTLMQKVFLQSSSTHRGFLSQGKLIRTMRVLLYFSIGWVVFSFAGCAFELAVIWDSKHQIYFTWMDPGDNKMGVRIVLVIFMLLGFIALDVVYSAVVINHSCQCSLLIFYVQGIMEKVRERQLDIQAAMRSIAETDDFIHTLNMNTGAAVSIVLFNFAAKTAMGLNAILNTSVQMCALQYASTIILALNWGCITIIPIVQAARLTAACRGLRKLGHEISCRPFGYQDTPTEELDFFLLYTSTLNMKAKLFGIPARSSYVCGIVLILCFALLLLFQLGYIHVWL